MLDVAGWGAVDIYAQRYERYTVLSTVGNNDNIKYNMSAMYTKHRDQRFRIFTVIKLFSIYVAFRLIKKLFSVFYRFIFLHSTISYQHTVQCFSLFFYCISKSDLLC